MAIFNFLLFISTVHDLVQHGTGCSLALLYPGSLLALYSRCAGSVHSVALYQRCTCSGFSRRRAGLVYLLAFCSRCTGAALVKYMLWLLPGAAPAVICCLFFSGSCLALSWCYAGYVHPLALHRCCTGVLLVLASCSLLALPLLCACAGSSLLLYMICSDISLAATGRGPSYTRTLAPCWLCAGFVIMPALSWLIPGTALATLSIYLCWPFPGTALDPRSTWVLRWLHAGMILISG
jgi:hypothetical protein